MAAVDFGTIKALTTRFGNSRKMVKTSTGVLVLFANLGNSSTSLRVQYKTSSDNGVTWDGSWTAAYTANDVTDFDVYIDGSNNIYLALDINFNNFAFRKLTYSGGSWTPETAVTLSGISYGAYRPSFTIRSNGDLWISSDVGGGNNTFNYFYSTDGGLNFTKATHDIGTGILLSKCIAVGTDIWVLSNTTNNKIILSIWNGSSWADSTIVNSGIVGAADDFSVIKISDSNIWVSALSSTTNGAKVFYYNGSSWDAGTDLTSNYEQYFTLGNIGGNPVLFYVAVNLPQKDIYYRLFNGSTWDAAVQFTNDATVEYYTSIMDTDSSWAYLVWCHGTTTLYFDKILLNPTIQKTILSDAKIKVLDNQKTITSDAVITSTVTKTILSDATIKIIDVQETILSDSKIIDLYSKTITSDSKIKAVGLLKTILSAANIVAPVLYDINQKIKFVLQGLYNTNNTFTMAIGVLSDINNFINTCQLVLSDITEDFRMKKLILNNVNNDIRFLYSWQQSATGILQSLGKGYIKVYIGGIEQTDVDVDSINISKSLSSAHTATFDLAKAYDSTKPTMEAIVLITYNDWTLYSGYITEISPADDPEKIRINCQDEYWKQDKTNVYYHVGHKPTDDKELYYDTLALALTTQHGWAPGIGNFVPQTLDNFAVGKSDAISNLIREAGNYGWFYDVNGNKILWTAGAGAIVELERQVIGENINLYDVISHSFEESVEDIVNKLRVQMGDKVIRAFNSTGGNRTYTGYNYSSYHQFVTPAWNSSYEVLAKNSPSGEGFDWQRPSNANLYKDVFTKYNMPYLNPELSSWSDRYPAYVEVYSTGWSIFNSVAEVITEGFTIDYEKGTITFNDPIYLYQTNASGEKISVRAPLIKVFLWKKNYFTYTVNPTDDPETDISNELMFFTSKMGTYPDTIIKDLNLSNLSIQVGGTIGTEYIPSWDDTAFATDLANWQLSKTCDKKIRGIVNITLDAACFYNIDLSKRIYIAGITDEAMNITNINYNMSTFTVTLTLENSRYYNRTISYQSHGE